MKIKFLYILSLLGVIFMLTSCFEGSGLISEKKSKPNNSLNLAISGSWSTLCFVESGVPYLRNFIFAGSRYSYIESKYNTGSECIGYFVSYIEEGVFSVGNAVTSSSGISVLEINFHYRENNQDATSYNIFSISDGGDTLYFGDSSSGSLPIRPVALNYNIPFFVSETTRTAVEFFNDFGETVTEIYIKLSSNKFYVELNNKINTPLVAGQSVKVPVFCDEYIDVRIKSSSSIIEERSNVYLNCNKSYSWPIDGN